MKAIKNFFIGVAKEAGRIRWLKGNDLTKAFLTVLGYAVFFGLFLVLTDLIVIKLLQAVHFK